MNGETASSPGRANGARTSLSTSPGLATRRLRRRVAIVLWALGLSVLGIYLLNAVVPAWNFGIDQWVFPPTLPTMRPLGNDFQVGIVRPAELLRAGLSPYANGSFYPPLVAVLGLPSTFLDPQAAYVIHALLLVVANVASLVVAVAIARRAFGGPSLSHAASARRIAGPLLLILGFLGITSYGFIFSLERGNYDAFPLLLGVVMLWLLVERPQALWLQAMLLALAVHLKVYPLVLVGLLFWVHRWKSLLPVASLNVALLFMLGWGPVKEWLSFIAMAQNDPAVWVGNHSAASFAALALAPAGLSFRNDGRLLALLPLALLAIGALVLWRRGFTPVNGILAFALAVPAMNLVPATSHDYKLVLLAVPMAMLVFGEAVNFAVDGGWRPAATLAVLVVLMGLLSHAYTNVRPYVVAEPAWLANRYPWILLLQLVAFTEVVAPFGVFLSRRRDGAVGATT